MGLKRLSLVVVLGVVVAAVLAGTASSLKIDEATCPDVAGEGTATCPTGTVGAPYSITFKEREGSGCGPGKQTFHITSGNPPPGLTLSTSGTLSGTPAEAGTWRFYIEIREPTDDPEHCRGDRSQTEFTLPVVPGLPKLTIGPESTTPGTTGKPYSLQLTATVPDPKTWSINSGTLPPGLAIDASTGLVSGTPAAAGQFDFQVLAKVNSDERTDTKVLAIIIRDPLGILGTDPFTPARRATGEVSVPFEALLAATGGFGTYVWSLTSGELPPGLTLTDGTIDGKPTTAGTYRFTATVTDTEGRVANYPARIIVAEKLSISTLLLRPAKLGFYYQAKLATAGGVLPRTWKVLRGPLPRGIRFDRWVGVLYGIPTRPGRWRVTFEATDALGVKAKKTLQIVVAAPPVQTKSG